MPRLATVYQVLIASPGDVLEERDLIESVVHEWNAANSSREGVMLQPIRWERDAYAQLGDRPQEIINSQLVQQADMLIGVFWTRLGTPTEKYRSGTEEEISKTVASGKPVAIYFSHKKVALEAVDLREYERLKNFRSEIQKTGLYKVYSSMEQLRSFVSFDITKHVSALKQRHLVGLPENSLVPRVEMHNLIKHRPLWSATFERHKGGFIVYSILQIDPHIPRARRSPVMVAAALLRFNQVTEHGIQFDWINPYKLKGDRDFRVFHYRGVALPAGQHFIYLFADQVGGDYEVLTAVIEYSPVYPPSLLAGHLLAVSVNVQGKVFRIGAAGISLLHLADVPSDPSEWFGKKLGWFKLKDVPEVVQDHIPRVYSR